MADFSALIAQIEAYVKQNGNNEITGNGLQSILVGMVNALGTVAITALQGDLADEVTARTNADGAINAKIPAEASSSNKLADKAFVTGLTTALQNAVNAIKADIENGYVYAGIATPSGTPVSGKVYYLARQAGTYTNFGGLTLTEGVNVLKYNGTAWSQEQLISIADIYKNPLMGYYECDTAGGTAAKTVAATGYVLPTTGGSVKIKMANRNTVANATLNINSTGAKPLFYNGVRAGVGNTWDTNEIVEVFYDGTNYQAYNVAGSNGDGVFDISAYNLTDGQPTPYVDLSAALGTNGEHVPQSLRKGGISVKFIQGSVPSSDNKYVQFRCMAQSFTTDVTQWQIVGVPKLLLDGYTFNGIINPNINPGTPEGKVFYVTSFSGEFPYIGLTIDEPSIWVISYDSVNGWVKHNLGYDIYPQYKSTQDYAYKVDSALPYIYGSSLEMTGSVNCKGFSSLAWDNVNLEFVNNSFTGYNGLCVPVLSGHKYNVTGQSPTGNNRLQHVIELSSLPKLGSSEGYIGVYTLNREVSQDTKYLFLTCYLGNDITITDVTTGKDSLNTRVSSLEPLLPFLQDYQFKGIINPNTVPGTPDHKVFYLTSFSGNFQNINLTIDEPSIWVITYDSTNGWSKHNLGYDIYPEFRTMQDYPYMIRQMLPEIIQYGIKLNGRVTCNSFLSISWDDVNSKFIINSLLGKGGILIPVVSEYDRYRIEYTTHGARNGLAHIIELSELPVLNSGDNYIGVYQAGSIVNSNTKYLFATVVWGQSYDIIGIKSESTKVDRVIQDFNIDTINNEKLFKKFVYENNFQNDIITDYVHECEVIKSNEELNYTWEFGKLLFSGTNASRSQILIKTPVTFEVPTFECELDVDADYDNTYGRTGSVYGVGLVKDLTNFLVVLNNKVNSQMQMLLSVGGSIHAHNFTYIGIEAPYTLKMSVDGELITMLAVKDDKTIFIGQYSIGGWIDFDEPDVLKEWKLGFGVWTDSTNDAPVLSGIRGSYFGGYSFGGDYHIITYEDGTPLIKDNFIYITASVHYSASYPRGISLYRMRVMDFTPEFCGILYFRESGQDAAFGGQSCKVVYDRDEHNWICLVTSFKVSPCKTYVCRTQQNILSGNHIIDCQVMGLPDVSNANWDIDIIKLNNTWYCVYTSDPSAKVKKCSASDVLGVWQNVETSTQSAEGAVIFKCNGKHYVSITESSHSGLKILDFDDLSLVGLLAVPEWCSKQGSVTVPNPWGTLFGISTNNSTEFYMLIFSNRCFENMVYAYGDLWIYKARQIENGSEYTLINNGIEEIQAQPIQPGYGVLPTNLVFDVMGIRHVGKY